MRAQVSTHDYEQLSAYLDGQLASGERKKLEVHLTTRPELQAALEDLRQTRALLRMAPRKRAPRNFTLTPAMVGDTGPSRKPARRWWEGFQLFPVLSFASAMTMLLLAAVLVFDLGQTSQRQTLTAAQAPAPAAKEAAQPQPAPFSATGAAVPNNAAGSTANTAEPPAAAVAAPADAQSAAPTSGPIIVWNAGGMGGGPGMATGKGGGGGGGGGGGAVIVDSRSEILNQYGLNSASGSNLDVPPAGVNSIASDAAAAPAAGAAAAQPAQPNPTIAGTGPILGAPAQAQAGQILDQRSNMGHPDAVGAGAPLPGEQGSREGQPEGAATLGNQSQTASTGLPWYAQPVIGIPVLRWIEGLLLLLALGMGTTAFVLWRRRRGI